MSNDLELRMRLTADNRGVAGTVRDTRREVKGLTGELSGVSGAARSTAGGMAGVTTAGEEANRMFRLQKGSLQQAGYQFQDFAVQVGSGTSAFVALGQQGSQLLGLLGPGGALLGAVLAIGSVVGGTFAASMGEGEDSTKALDAALKSLDATIEVNDGIPELTRQIRELARESEVAARARISSALLAAEDAAKSAARGVGEAFGELSIGELFGLRDLEDFTESLGTFEAYLQAGYIQDELQELGELFGFSGEAAQRAGREIGELLTRLRSNPSFDNFNALEDAMGRLSVEGGEPNEAIIRLIGNLGTYFDSARDAEERTQALNSALKDLSGSIRTDAADEIDKMISKLRMQAETQGKNTLEMIEYNRQVDLAAAKEAAAGAEKVKLINKYYDQIYLYEQSTLAAEREAEAQEELTRAQREYSQSVQQLVNELDPLGAQFQSLYEKQQLLIQAAADGKISDSYRDTLIRNLVEGVADAGDESGGEFAERMEQQMSIAGQRVASSLQNSITSGDWDSVGGAIGGALAGAIGGMVTDALERQLSGQAGAAIIGPIGGAIAGGLAGLAVNALSDFFSDSDWDPTAARQAAQGTGTVLGDINAKSESIRRAVEGSESGIGQLVGINQSMLQALKTLQLGIEGAVARVARARDGISFDTSNLYSQTQLAGGGLGLGLGGVMTGSFGPAFGFAADMFDTIDGVLGGVISEAVGFLDKVTGGLLSSIGSSVFGGDQDVKDVGIQLFGGTLEEMIRGWRADSRYTALAYATIEEDGGWFGSDDRWDEFRRLGPDAERQISLVFSGIRDSVVAGAESLGMASDDIDDALDQFRVKTQKISLEDLSADEQAAELTAVFSSIFDNLASAVVPYVDEFQKAGEGLGETLARVANETLVTQEAVHRLGIQFTELFGRDLVEASERLMNAAGGIESFISSMNGFIEKFATDTQKFQLAQSDLTRSFAELDLSLPGTRAGYYNLLQAQNGATEAGAENIAMLLRLQDAADTYYTLLEDRQSELLTSGLREAEEAAQAVTSALDSLSVETDAFSRQQRAAALDTLRSMVESGVVRPGSELTDALEAVTSINPREFETVGDYIRETAKAGGVLADLDAITQEQVTVEQRMLDSLEQQNQLLIDGNSAQIAALSSLQASVDRNTVAVAPRALSGISTSGAFGPDAAAMVDEVRALRAELKASQLSIARHTQKSARVLERLEINGIEVRE